MFNTTHQQYCASATEAMTALQASTCVSGGQVPGPGHLQISGTNCPQLVPTTGHWSVVTPGNKIMYWSTESFTDSVNPMEQKHAQTKPQIKSNWTTNSCDSCITEGFSALEMHFFYHYYCYYNTCFISMELTLNSVSFSTNLYCSLFLFFMSYQVFPIKYGICFELYLFYFLTLSFFSYFHVLPSFSYLFTNLVTLAQSH